MVVENDANAAALAELWFGNAKNVSNFLLLKDQYRRWAPELFITENSSPVPAEWPERSDIFLYKKTVALAVAAKKDALKPICTFPMCLNGTRVKPVKRLKTGLSFIPKICNQDPVACQILEELVETMSIAVSLSGGLLDLDMVVISGVWANFKELLINRLEQNFQTILELSGLKKNSPSSARLWEKTPISWVRSAFSPKNGLHHQFKAETKDNSPCDYRKKELPGG